MALSLDAIRTFVRAHLDLDEEDLPNSVLDIFIREGSKRIERAAPRWPFYEKTWSFSTVSGQREYAFSTIGSDVDQITAISRDDMPLQWIGSDLYNVINPTTSGTTSKPLRFSWWGTTLSLQPTPDGVYALTVQGYRTPIDWVANGAGATPDLPDELHNTVATWALAKAYTQQEDPELGAVYERQFAEELSEFKRRLDATPSPHPLVLNGQSMYRMWPPLWPPRFDWQA